MSRPIIAITALLLGGAVLGAGWFLLADEEAPAPTPRNDHVEVGETPEEEWPTTESSDAPIASSEFTNDFTPAPGAIKGKVRDAEGRALAGATVTVRLGEQDEEAGYALVAHYKESLTTDDEGNFHFQVPGGGRYDLFATCPGHSAAGQRRVLPGSEVTLELGPPLGLSGLVVEAETGAPIEGVQLWLHREQPLPALSAVTDAGGAFRFEDLPARELKLDAVAPLHVSRRGLPVDPRDHLEAPLRLALDTGKRVLGTVHARDDGRPISDAEVRAGDKTVQVRDGRFEIGGLPAAPVQVRVLATGYLSQEQSVQLAGSRAEASVEFHLRSGGELQGRVLDPDGEAVVGARVDILRSWRRGSSRNAALEHLYKDWNSSHLEVVTDSFGRFRLLGVPGGRQSLVVRARHPDWPDALSELIEPPKDGEFPYVEVRCHQGLELGGTVTNAEGEPLEGVRVALYQENRYGGPSTNPVVGTDAEGKFLFTGLAEGRYLVRAVAKGYPSVSSSRVDLLVNKIIDPIELKLQPGEPMAGIVESADGKPLAGVKVQLSGRGGSGSAITDVEGRFEIESLPKGPWTANASKEGFADYNRRRVKADDEGLVRIKMHPRAALTGQVLAAEDDTPVQHFRVLVTGEVPNRPGQVRTVYDRWVRNEEGRFKAQVPDGTWKLTIEANGRVTQELEGREVVAERGDSEPVTVLLVGGGTVEGYARDIMGRGMGGVNVYHRRGPPHDERLVRVTQTEADGYFLLQGLSEGWQDLVFERGSHGLVIEEGVSVVPGTPSKVEVTLRRDTGIVLAVTGLKKPIPGQPNGSNSNSRSGDFEVSLGGWDGIGHNGPVRVFRSSRRQRLSVTLRSLEHLRFDIDSEGHDARRRRTYVLRTEDTRTLRIHKDERFTWTDLPAGHYELTMKWPGLPAIVRRVTVPFGGVAEVACDLEALRAELYPEEAAAGAR